MRERQDQRGVTLIELIVVLVVLALLAAVAVPNFFRNFQNISTKNSLLSLQKRIRLAQYHSLMEGRLYSFRYDERTRAYTFFVLEKKGGNKVWQPVRAWWGKPESLPSEDSLSISGKNQIYFYPNGNMATPDIVYKTRSDIYATLRLGQSLLGVEIDRKEAARV